MAKPLRSTPPSTMVNLSLLLALIKNVTHKRKWIVRELYRSRALHFVAASGSFLIHELLMACVVSTSGVQR